MTQTPKTSLEAPTETDIEARIRSLEERVTFAEQAHAKVRQQHEDLKVTHRTVKKTNGQRISTLLELIEYALKTAPDEVKTYVQNKVNELLDKERKDGENQA